MLLVIQAAALDACPCVGRLLYHDSYWPYTVQQQRAQAATKQYRVHTKVA